VTRVVASAINFAYPDNSLPAATNEIKSAKRKVKPDQNSGDKSRSTRKKGKKISKQFSKNSFLAEIKGLAIKNRQPNRYVRTLYSERHHEIRSGRT
jgi:hypothetical protein